MAAAMPRRGSCAPNPSVGAVLISQSNDLIATGTHWASGCDHAEVDAIKKAGDQAASATLYVTLEPCSHTGKTPPCTQAILDAGIAAVLYGYADPNPAVSGLGAQWLREQGVRCEQLILPEINDYYRAYSHWLKTGKPLLAAKLAQSLDGITAKACGSPLAITGDEAALYTAKRRQQADAILTSVSTVLADDPRLNCRVGDCVESKPVYVLDSMLRFPDSARLLKTAEEVVLLHASDVGDKKSWPLNSLRAIAVGGGQHQLDLERVATALGKEGLHEVWIEAGPTLFQAFLDSGLLSEALIYQSPNAVGEGLSGVSLSHEQLVKAEYVETSMGDDTLFRFVW